MERSHRQQWDPPGERGQWDPPGERGQWDLPGERDPSLGSSSRG